MPRLHLALLPAVTLAAACVAQPPAAQPLAAQPLADRAAGPSLPPAPLPRFTVGDRVSWSNGNTETVVAVDGEKVTWEDQNGNSFTGYRNVTLPSLRWSYPNNRAVTEMDVPPTQLWPLEVGKRAHFTVVQTQTLYTSENTYSMEWECGVDGTERVTVALGSFDAFRLRCARYWRGSNVGEVYWSYAPALGRVVKRSWSGADRPEELVAIGTGSLDARAEKIAAKVRVKALEAAESGARARGRVNDIVATVTPTATFATSTGRYCRDFLQQIQTAKASAVTAATACRAPSGAWTVVDRIKDSGED